MTELPLILIIEDNPEIGPFVAMELQSEGYRTELASDGFSGLTKFRNLQPDLLILDWEMPNMSGIDVCRRVRQSSHVPIIMLTAKEALHDKVAGLDAGANDYLSKPFELEELLARVRVQLRTRQLDPLKHLTFGELEMNLQTHEVQRNGIPLDLSPREFDLLKYLMAHPRQVLSKAQIFEQVWGWDAEGHENAVEVYVHSLRSKLEQNQAPRLIQTKRGVGYLLREPAAD